MPICFVNPDGSHVRGCDAHLGAHPHDWCQSERERRVKEIHELEARLSKLRTEDYGNEWPQVSGGYSAPVKRRPGRPRRNPLPTPSRARTFYEITGGITNSETEK